jgi:hypothetical protein
MCKIENILIGIAIAVTGALIGIVIFVACLSRMVEARPIYTPPITKEAALKVQPHAGLQQTIDHFELEPTLNPYTEAAQ